MKTRIAVLLIVACSATANATTLDHDPIVASTTGGGNAYVGPGGPYDLNRPLSLAISVGYGSPANTVGGHVFHNGPATIDVSSEIGFAGFMEYATNGIDDAVHITVTDTDGFQRLHRPNYTEYTLYGVPILGADLFELTSQGIEITGAQMRILSVGYSDNPPGYPGIAIAFDFFGVPEPTSCILLALGVFGLARRTRGA